MSTGAIAMAAVIGLTVCVLAVTGVILYVVRKLAPRPRGQSGRGGSAQAAGTGSVTP